MPNNLKSGNIATVMMIIIIMIVAFSCGCNIDGSPAMPQSGGGQDTIIIDPIPIEQPDTCVDYVEVTEPPFVNMTVEMLPDFFTEIIIVAGSFTDTVQLSDQIGITVDSLLELFKPQYEYSTTVHPEDPRIFTTLVDGTNDHQQFLLKTYLRYNGVKHYFGCASQSFYFAGAMDPINHEQAAINYPSVNRFNFRGTNWDSLTYEKIDTIILGHCKAGRDWADFRWGIHSDSIIELFKIAGWGQVLTANGGASENMTINLTGIRASESIIMMYLKQGYQVIVTDD